MAKRHDLLSLARGKTVLPLDLCTVTMTEAQWFTVCTALGATALKLAEVGNDSESNEYMNAYNALREAMGMDT